MNELMDLKKDFKSLKIYKELDDYYISSLQKLEND